MDEPFFSIIVPTYRRPGQLTTCLDALARLDYPTHRFEVIVVNDESSLLPAELVTRFPHTFDVTFLAQSHAGPAAARNTGASSARGEFLAFTDDDCVPTSGWLRGFAARFAAAPDRAIGGRTLNSLIGNPYSSASQTIVDLVYSYYNVDPHRARFFASNNLALPAHQFRAIGGFDPTFTTSEDRDLCDRWLSCGHQMMFAPEALIYHAHPLTFRTFVRQHFNYGRGAFRFHQARLRRGSGGFKPALDFHLTILRRPLLLGGSRRLQMLKMVLWQLANTAGFLWETIDNRARPHSARFARGLDVLRAKEARSFRRAP